jgi:hypothetical protein
LTCLVAALGGPPGPNWKDDADEDGWIDADDNCPQLANFDQADGDGNSVGDACQDEHPEIASADSISCFDVATDDVGEPHIVYVARAEVGGAKQLRHLYETDAGWMTETLHDANTLLECAADFNHEGELCVAFKASGGDNTQARYGCLDAAGEFHASKFEEMGAPCPPPNRSTNHVPIGSWCTTGTTGPTCFAICTDSTPISTQSRRTTTCATCTTTGRPGSSRTAHPAAGSGRRRLFRR